MTLNIWDQSDVLVAGGGTAGVVAAVAAARSGARTRLVEQSGIVGGTAVTAVQPLIAFHDNANRQIVGGVGWELAQRLLAMGAAAHTINDVETKGAYALGGSNYTLRKITYHPEALKYVCFEMLQEAGVDLLLHTFASDALMQGSAIGGLEVVNKSGRAALPARVVVDCTGDGDVAARAGAPYESGRPSDGVTQPVTPVFTLSDVDLARAKEAGIFEEVRYRLIGEGSWLTRYQRGIIHLTEWADELRRELPDYVGPGFVIKTLGDGIYHGGNKMHFTRVDPTDVVELSRLEAKACTTIWKLVQFLRAKAPGFENCHLIQTYTIGIRETRRVLGDAYLTLDDVLGARRHRDDIALCGYYVDVHHHDGVGHNFPAEGTQVSDGQSYGIPYGCLVPRNVENLLVAGRCFSASHEAHASARVMGTCMAMGHAAGAAAALAAEQGLTPRQLDIRLLQETLSEQGAILL